MIEADQAWFEGSELHYRRNGTVYAVPRSLVERVDTADGSAALEDPDTRSSRERLAAGDPAEALRFARLALFRQPASVPALQALAAAQIALGQGARAREAASTALGLEPGNARSLELLGDALVESGDFASAREPYRLSLEVADEPRVRKKLDALFTSAASVSSARFRIRYDGAADEPLGLAVLQVLDSAWDEYERRLGFTPTPAGDGGAADGHHLPRHHAGAGLGGGLERRDDPRAGGGHRPTDPRPRAGPAPRAGALLRGRPRGGELPHVASRGARAVAGGRRSRARGRQARPPRPGVPPAAPRVARAALRRDVGGGRHGGVRAEPVGGGPTAQERGRSRRAPFGRGPGPRAPRQGSAAARLSGSATASCSGPGRPTCAPPAASRRRRPRHQAFAERACKPDSVPAACAARRRSFL